MYGVSGYTHMWLDFWVDTCVGGLVGTCSTLYIHLYIGRWGNRQKDLGTGEVGR